MQQGHKSIVISAFNQVAVLDEVHVHVDMSTGPHTLQPMPAQLQTLKLGICSKSFPGATFHSVSQTCRPPIQFNVCDLSYDQAQHMHAPGHSSFSARNPLDQQSLVGIEQQTSHIPSMQGLFCSVAA